MAPVHTKLFIGGAVIAGALGYLGVSGVRSGWVYYVDVDSYVRDGAAGARSRVHGAVAPEGLEVGRADLVARFVLVGGRERLNVEYRGAIPDTFAAGREVVVEGASDRAGVFQADLLLTRCASKYQGQANPPGTAGGPGPQR
jgi:cytochrome c-type biogenesis protein CcmE